MNTIREINRINDKEIELGHVGGMGPSWHDDWRDTAYIYVGGLPNELTEGDVLIIFSQYGEIVDIHMPRDKETGKVRGFGFLMYEDQRSTILAVDNMNGGKVLGRTVRVDHTRYKQKQSKDEHGDWVDPDDEPSMNAMPKTTGDEDASSDESDPDLADPMAAYLRDERKRDRGLITAEGSSSKKDGKKSKESKEEKRARKAEKRDKKARKEAERMQLKFEEEYAREMRDEGEEARRGVGEVESRSRRDYVRVKHEERSPLRRELKREPSRSRSPISRSRQAERNGSSTNGVKREPSYDRERTRSPEPRTSGTQSSRGYQHDRQDRSDRRSPRGEPQKDDWRQARTETRRDYRDEPDENRDRRRTDHQARHQAERVMKQMDRRAGVNRNGNGNGDGQDVRDARPYRGYGR